MIPFLLPLILWLYGEFSKDMTTRYISRTILYGYAFSVIFQSYVPAEYSLYVGMGIFLSAMTLSLFYATTKTTQVCFSLVIILVFINFWSLITNDPYIVQNFPLYSNNSNQVIRELILFGVFNFRNGDIIGGNDEYLATLCTMMLVMEYVLL
ncbi:anti-holin [Vibrio phage ICP1]|nr:anti-holin [Vibrio phage ICP1]QVW05748.1 anti-holin [Vibrio phage ICP1]QVW06195.1 anti-holin [Vibrio phage ICP1]